MTYVFYHLFEMSHRAMLPARAAADGMRSLLANPFNPFSYTAAGRNATAAVDVFERITRRYAKPAFNLPTTKIDGRDVAVTEEIVWQRPFCNLIRFNRAITPAAAARQPRLLLVAPMSGHYATLLRGTVENFLPDHEVYITDWTNAGDVAPANGSFDLDDYVDYIRDMLGFLKGDVHVFAVCQPSVPVLAAIARMEAEGDPNVPRSMILAGGPIDTRLSPTVVNKLAVDKGTEWFQRSVINSVPWPNRGAGRKVYPGFLQLSGFMSMNMDKHMKAHRDLFAHLVDGDGDSVDKHKEFYDEYLAVMDLTEEFYMQTIDRVFVNHQLPKGELMHRAAKVDLSKIKRVALLTVEGENDDITGRGQCSAAIDLCSGIPDARKLHFECPKVGHYGVFSGSRFRNEIAPRMRHFVRRFDTRTVATSTAVYRAPALSLVTGGHDASHEDTAFTFAKPGEPAVAIKSAARKVVATQATTLAAKSADVQPQAPRHSAFDPFAPFAIFSPAATMRFWSMTSQAMLGPWSMLGGVTPEPEAVPAVEAAE
jgi:poly(3-hydroxybutyrate) depolymerase